MKTHSVFKEGLSIFLLNMLFCLAIIFDFAIAFCTLTFIRPNTSGYINHIINKKYIKKMDIKQ